MTTEQKLLLAFDRYQKLANELGRFAPQSVAAHRDWHILAYGPLPELLSIQPAIRVVLP